MMNKTFAKPMRKMTATTRLCLSKRKFIFELWNNYDMQEKKIRAEQHTASALLK